jgi:hypothetical protein
MVTIAATIIVVYFVIVVLTTIVGALSERLQMALVYVCIWSAVALVSLGAAYAINSMARALGR